MQELVDDDSFSSGSVPPPPPTPPPPSNSQYTQPYIHMDESSYLDRGVVRVVKFLLRQYHRHRLVIVSIRSPWEVSERSYLDPGVVRAV